MRPGGVDDGVEARAIVHRIDDGVEVREEDGVEEGVCACNSIWTGNSGREIWWSRGVGGE